MNTELSKMKTAIVADWLTTFAGSERVLEQLISCFPNADLFSVVDFLSESDRGFLQGKKPTTTFIQSLPFSKRLFRNYLPLMPIAIEQVDLSSYDLILSSSHAVAKGVIVGPNQLHISYVHSPMRYAWDLQFQYLREAGLDRRWVGWLVRFFLHKLRIWDVSASSRVDYFLANSEFIKARIKKVYGRDASVIYPPVDVDTFTPGSEKQDFFLTASRMVPYKRMDLIVSAFKKMPNRRLVVIGDGPEFAKIQRLAGSNVKLMGYQSQEVLRACMRNARAFLFAAEEDFGIVPVEAQASGTPVIAFGKGGTLETVVGLGASSFPTGVFFYEQNEESLIAAIDEFELNRDLFDSENIRKRAELFSAPRFRSEVLGFVESVLSTRKA